MRTGSSAYIAAILLIAFISIFLLYLGQLRMGIAIFAVSFFVCLAFAIQDRVVFDGRRLYRTGMVPRLWYRMNGRRDRLRITDIEQSESHALRMLKLGGRIVYRYRTLVRGKGIEFTISGRGKGYRVMAEALLKRLPKDLLDNRSIEIRDYISDPRLTRRRAETARIPSDDVLESSYRSRIKTARPGTLGSQSGKDLSELRQLANQLKVAGSLRQSLEAFRRALLLRPTDGWLLFEAARCVRSLAALERNVSLERTSIALLRLSEQRAQGDGELLARLGESYLRAGKIRRSEGAFRLAQKSIGDSFRTLRGMAEVALRKGKIAHVLHNFSAAHRIAGAAALKRWTKGEVEYFSKLNDDQEYLELELSRISLLETIERGRRQSLVVTALGLLTIPFGMVIGNDVIAELGFTVSGIGLVLWLITKVFGSMLSTRLSYDLFIDDAESGDRFD
ncbi:MAG: hypothetical protein ABI539_03950 [Acidobacteriota bacterium]